MKHPLVNPSLTPHGFGVGNTYTRTTWKSDDSGRYNGDWGAARFWQEANRLDVAYRPAEHIVHEIMPSMRTIGRTHKGDFVFDGKPYLSQDLAVMTSAAVWIATNCGGAMLANPLCNVTYTKTNEFRVRWREYEKPQANGHLLRHLLHTCEKGKCGHGGFKPCPHFHKSATERESLVLDAFLFWLGTMQGREYLARFQEFQNRTAKNVWNGYVQRRDSERAERRKQTQSAS